MVWLDSLSELLEAEWLRSSFDILIKFDINIIEYYAATLVKNIIISGPKPLPIYTNNVKNKSSIHNSSNWIQSATLLKSSDSTDSDLIKFAYEGLQAWCTLI